MAWIVYSLLAGVIWAIVNIIDKFVISKLVKKPIVQIIFLGLMSLLTAIGVAIFHGIGVISPWHVIVALISGVLYTGMTLFYFKAMMADDVSSVIPLFKLNPLFVAILASIFLGEVFTPVKYLAVLLLLIGSMMINYQKSSSIILSKAFWLVAISAIFLAVSQILNKYLLNFSDYWTVFSWVRIGSFVAVIPLIVTQWPNLVYTVKHQGGKTIGLISLSELLNLAAVLLITIATVTGFVTLTNALSMLQPLFVLIFASLISIYYPKILKEETSGSSILLKALAIVIMIIGAVLIV